MCVETSKKDERYNCIAWALGFNHVRLWPDSTSNIFLWPRQKPAIITVQEFTDVFALFGYHVDKIGFEAGYEKIALYLDDDTGEPTHAARQSPTTGKWSAKLGGFIDVEQDHLRDFPPYPPYAGGTIYGTPTYYYKRAVGKYATFEQVAECHGVWPLPIRVVSPYEAAG